MPTLAQARDRRTSVDLVFDHLHKSIVTLELLPGDKISEADIAAQFGVSRQPVRDAFSRLENLNLLMIRPQKATEVKRFSSHEITKSRFVRASVESEVLRRAAKHATALDGALLEASLAHQALVVEAGNYEEFGKLDYVFHENLCKIAKVDFAFEVIAFEKAHVDRLCMLGLAKEDRMPQLLADHRAIAAAVGAGKAEEAVAAGMLHLSRLDATIESIQENNPDYFDD
ncbi:GntR family transcriptional regulator [Abyssibius alkaniclasticus]|mgnify:FL=1|uniref:GntR family transcriptional regulator n=1 Tax=Abyssibius alkaniclasticus TaxID=2881234 RepID=UPI002363F294|nr:GntR family transcriptional regulator [Abyssibius alkaniclasticus]UPH72719.1 GntR family transcriptional regulator [Abyssibius alkaniclasticus]|tara:strand:+ start:459 stop:1142 length:684 start_codon:yes stop_codon:yes gene_type:complete